MPTQLTEARYGCNYCFKTLDPEDSDIALREIVQCRTCRTLYHEDCWQKLESCTKCGVKSARYVSLDSPIPLQINPRQNQLLPVQENEIDSLIHRNSIPLMVVVGFSVAVSLIALLACLVMFAYTLGNR